MNPTCMSYWWPLVSDLPGIETPRTVLLRTDVELSCLLDGEMPAGFESFVDELRSAAASLGGFPIFLRTGQGSGKHDWADTCFVRECENLGQHVYNLVEWSCTVDFYGLEHNVWAVREYLPTAPSFRAFNGMPIVREARCFATADQFLGWHPYWPAADVFSFGADTGFECHVESLHQFSAEEIERLTALSLTVASAVPGAWSIDWLDVPSRGWVLTDMAEMHKSFVWTDWPDAPASA